MIYLSRSLLISQDSSNTWCLLSQFSARILVFKFIYSVQTNIIAIFLVYIRLKNDRNNTKFFLSPNGNFFRGFPFKPELLLLLSTSLKWLQKSDISFLIYACQRLIYMVIIIGVSTPVEFQLTPLLPSVKVTLFPQIVSALE